MVVQLHSMPINNDMNTLPERFERKYYLIPPEVEFAYGLLRQICVMDSEYPSEQISSLYFDTADLDQYARSLSGDFQKDKVRIRWYSYGEKLSGTQAVFTELKSRRGFASTK
jgi:SPX domain protein involved in polyphosphate accumulation